MNEEVTSLAKVSEWNSFLTERTDQIAEMLFQPDMAIRLIKLMLTAMSRNPVLLTCSKESILYAIIEMGQLQLEPGALGECYIVPFYNSDIKKHEAQFMPGYRGLVKLARRSGSISNITAEVVYENDVFDYEMGLNPFLKYKPILVDTEEERGEIKYFYAIGWPKDGSQAIFEVMTKEQVDGIRARSKAKSSGPWVTDYIEMGRKTVTKKLTKRLDLSPELAAAVAMDNAFEAGEDPRLRRQHPMFGDAVEPDVEEKQKKTDSVLDMLDGIEPPDIPERPSVDPDGPEETPPAEDSADVFARADDREATTQQIEAVRTTFAELCQQRDVKKAGEQEELLLARLGVESFEQLSGEQCRKAYSDLTTGDSQTILDWIEFQREAMQS